MKKFMSFVNILVLVITISTFALAADGYELRYNLQVGDQFIMETAQMMDMEQEMMGQVVNMTYNLLSTYQLTVKDATAGIYTLEGKFLYLKSEFASPQLQAMPAEFSALLNQDLTNALADVTFTIRFTNLGEVLSFSGSEDILKAIAHSFKSQGSMQLMLMSYFEGMFSEAEMVSSWSDNLQLYPKEAIAVGESWIETVEITDPVPMEITTEYILKEVKDGQIIVEVHDEYSANASVDNAQVGELTMDVVQEGLYNIDLATYWPAMVDVKQIITGNISVETDNGVIYVPIEVTAANKIKTEF